MGRNNWFEFKQFRIEQHHAAMKVGTDGVLLGAWTPVNDAQRILDVGTGTGLIALMLAQRSEALIDAVEIDNPAAEEAKFNFEQSKWSNRLTVIPADFYPFSVANSGSYDLIVSNPPYFVNSLKSGNKALAIARHNQMLTFRDLIAGARNLLSDHGRFCVIIPFGSFIEFSELARLEGFFPGLQTTVFPQVGKAPKRILLEFTREPGFPAANTLAILDEKGLYTQTYKQLTAAYYPAF